MTTASDPGERALVCTLLLVGCAGPGPADLDADPPDLRDDGCRGGAPPSGDRLVLAGLPYDSAGAPSPRWAALHLEATGEIRDEGARFDWGRNPLGEVRWTPDGSLGLMATQDGGLARFDGVAGEPLTEARGDWYAQDVWIEPSGEIAWITDPNWPDNGGGLYRAAIDCETGELGDAERVLETKLAAELVVDGERAWVVSRTDAGFVGLEVDLAAGTAVEVGVLFPDDSVIADVVLSGGFLLASDHAEFTANPNRVAALDLSTGTTQVLNDVLDAVSLIDGGGGVLAVSGYGNSVRWLANSGGVWSAGGPPAWSGPAPQLPGRAVPIDGGVLLAENQGIRALWFDEPIADEGVLWGGSGFEAIVGGLGVRP